MSRSMRFRASSEINFKNLLGSHNHCYFIPVPDDHTVISNLSDIDLSVPKPTLSLSLSRLQSCEFWGIVADLVTTTNRLEVEFDILAPRTWRGYYAKVGDITWSNQVS